MGAIGASFVDDAAAVRAAFDGEVNTGHVIVVGNGKLRTIRSPANERGLPIRDGDLLARERTSLDFEEHSHAFHSIFPQMQTRRILARNEKPSQEEYSHRVGPNGTRPRDASCILRRWAQRSILFVVGDAEAFNLE